MSDLPPPSREVMRCGIYEWVGAVTNLGTVLLVQATSHHEAGFSGHPIRFRIAHDSGDVFWTATLEDDHPEVIKESIRAKAAKKGVRLSERWRSACAEVMVQMQEENARFMRRFTDPATVTPNDAQAMKKAFFEAYPGVAAWVEQTKARAKSKLRPS